MSLKTVAWRCTLIFFKDISWTSYFLMKLLIISLAISSFSAHLDSYWLVTLVQYPNLAFFTWSFRLTHLALRVYSISFNVIMTMAIANTVMVSPSIGSVNIAIKIAGKVISRTKLCICFTCNVIFLSPVMKTSKHYDINQCQRHHYNHTWYLSRTPRTLSVEKILSCGKNRRVDILDKEKIDMWRTREIFWYGEVLDVENR